MRQGKEGSLEQKNMLRPTIACIRGKARAYAYRRDKKNVGKKLKDNDCVNPGKGKKNGIGGGVSGKVLKNLKGKKWPLGERKKGKNTNTKGPVQIEKKDEACTSLYYIEPEIISCWAGGKRHQTRKRHHGQKRGL